jgi:Tfp pilus assembly protein PilO
MNPKRYFYALLGVLGVLVVAGGVSYYFALQMITTTSKQLSIQQAEQIAADAELKNLARLQRQYDRDIVPILGLMDQALPRTKNQTAILVQLQQIANESGLSISGATFVSGGGLPTATSQTIKAGTLLALPISFQVQGSYTQLQTFLTKVETLSRFTNVTNLAISRADKTKPIVYSMTVNAYIKP